MSINIFSHLHKKKRIEKSLQKMNGPKRVKEMAAKKKNETVDRK